MINHLSLKADAVKPHSSTVRTGQLVKRLIKRYAPIAASAGIELRMVMSSRQILTDPSLLERAIGNLISNAIEHSGGSRILVGVRPDGPGYLRIWVIDDGRGVLDADVPHVFDEYYRGAETLSSAKGGFGIGLASASRIAKLLGGCAGYAKVLHKGAAFYIKVPDYGPPT